MQFKCTKRQIPQDEYVKVLWNFPREKFFNFKEIKIFLREKSTEEHK